MTALPGVGSARTDHAKLARGCHICDDRDLDCRPEAAKLRDNVICSTISPVLVDQVIDKPVAEFALFRESLLTQRIHNGHFKFKTFSCVSIC